MAWPEPLVLRSDYCMLEPLSLDHHDALIEAVKDGELWNLWYAFVPKPEGMKKEIVRRLELQTKGSMLSFAVISQKPSKSLA